MTPDEILERSQWDFFWVPDDAVVTERPELAYVCCPRDIHYLNVVTRTRVTDSKLDATIREVRAAHAGRRSRWLACPQSPRALEAVLERHGYVRAWDHDGFVLTTDTQIGRKSSGIEVRPVATLDELRVAVDVAQRAFGHSLPTSDEDLQRGLVQCAGPGARVHRVVAFDVNSGAPLAAAGMTVFEDLSFAYFWGGGTLEEARGRGAYSALVTARVERARSRGVRLVGMYARIDSSAPIVAKQGFERHGRMSYWECEPV